MTKTKKITTEDLKNVLNDFSVQIIDARPVDNYNGWKKFNEKRGGHIKGARSLPVKWLNYLDWLDIVKGKNIMEDQTIIICSYSSQDSEKVVERFELSGYSKIMIYTEFLKEWVNDESLPMEKLTRYKHLVSAEWLYQLIETGKAPEYDNDKFVLCHGHYQNLSDYEKGHIKGAIAVDSNTLESPETWNRRTPEELKLLKDMG